MIAIKMLAFSLWVVVLGAIICSGGEKMEQQPLRFWYRYLPSTYDTYEADGATLMPIAKNIYAPLVSTFVVGKPQGMIAKDWKVDSTGRIWQFTIRPGLTFDDGTPITPEAVLANFKRMLWLTRNEGLLLNSLLPEVKTWKKYSDPLQSLYVEGNVLVFKMNRRPINLFETIEQAIYGIANPKCFDGDGKWIDPKCFSGSGQYRVKDLSTAKMVLESRHIFPEVVGAPDVVEVNVSGAKDPTAIQTLMENKGDMTIRYSYELNAGILKEMTSKGLTTVNEPLVRMHFLQLNASHGAFKSRSLRQSFRDVFLSSLSKDRGFSAETELDPSFMPKGSAGYVPFNVPQVTNISRFSEKEVTVVLTVLSKTAYSRSFNIYTAAENSIFEAIKAHKLKTKVIRCSAEEWFERKAKGDFDIVFGGSGLLINNPYADLRMMFMSKIGSNIPDPSGKIPGMIEAAENSENPSRRQEILKKINSSIYTEASVINFMHSGKVYVHRNGVDLSKINLFSDPVEFRAVSWSPTAGKR